MIVPLIPVKADRDGRLYCGKISFEDGRPKVFDEMDYLEAISSMTSSTENKRPVVVMDVKGLNERGMNIDLLKNLKIRGSRVMFMTYIRTVDDVLDAFNTDADSVIMPVQTVKDGYEMDCILEISDSVIPLLLVKERRTVFYRMKKEPLWALRELEKKGFRRFIVMDTDGDLELNDWKDLSGYEVLPYSESITDEEFSSIGMNDVLRCLL